MLNRSVGRGGRARADDFVRIDEQRRDRKTGGIGSAVILAA